MINNPYAKWDEQADPEVPPGTAQIYKFIADDLMQADKPDVFRCSAATMCVKRRWFQGKGAWGKPLTPRKILNFTTGDLGERVMTYFIQQGCVGPGKLYKAVKFGDVKGYVDIQGKQIPVHNQVTNSFKLGERRVTGHFDGLGQRQDGTWELIEVKTASSFGFKKFKETGPDDYLKQSHAYGLTDICQDLKVEGVRFFYFRKETGHIWDSYHQFKQVTFDLVKQEFLESVGEEMPKDPYPFVPELYRKKPTGKMIPQWQCQYCPFIEGCKGEHTIEWKKTQWGNYKPIYIFK